MNIDEKLTLLMAVEESGFNVKESLKRMDIPRSTYYLWRASNLFKCKRYLSYIGQSISSSDKWKDRTLSQVTKGAS